MSDANLMAESYAEEASNNNIAHDEENKPCCKFCGKKFAQSSYIKAHMRLHTGEKPFSCSFCPKRFSDCSNWKKHERIHIRQMGINLDKVPQSPSSPSKSSSFSLDSYQPSPTSKAKSDLTSNGNLTCKICNKSFSNASSLTTHKRIHTGDRPYRCHTCGKSFTQIGTLRTHERIHTGQKPYTCKFCGQTFAQSGSFRMHERRHMMDMLHKCPICPVKFSQWEDAKEHLASHPEISGSAEFIKNQMAAAAQDLTEDDTLPHIESFAGRPDLHLEQFPPPGFPFPPQLTPFLNVSAASLHLGGPFPGELPAPVGMFTAQMIKTEAMSNMLHATSPTDLRQPMVTTSQPSPFPENTANSLQDNGDTAIVSTTTARDRKYSSDSHTPDGTPDSTPDVAMDNGGQKNEQEEKTSMETDNHPVESDRKAVSEESSVVSDHSDNGQTEETNGIKSRNLHGRLLSNSRKQKHPMRRYSGSVLSTGSLDPDTSTHPSQSMMTESDSIYSGGDQSVEEFLDISSVTGKLYRCDHCHIIFEDCTLYLLHNGFHSHDNDPFKCVICRTSCRDRIEFNCHLTSHIK